MRPPGSRATSCPPGRRLGLPEDAYDVGERGAVCERWLASTTKADNRVGPPDEGLSHVVGEHGERLLLRDAVAAGPAAVMGAAYAATHPGGLGRLAKIFDYAYRLPYHIHPPQEYAALVGRNAKDESYHFLPGVDMGPHPETFFGVHPWIAEQGAYEVLLPYLVDWDSDLILRHARAELQVPGEGFHVPSGVLHAPRHGAHPGAAGGLRRPRHVPGAERRPDHLQGPAVQGRPPRRPLGARGAVPARLRGLAHQRRPLVLREPPPDPAARCRRGELGLLQHRQVRRQAPRRPARRRPPAARARRVQRVRLDGDGHVRGARGARRRTGA
ncbi:hypothetical protein [Nonomuraea salmonea]|uniref:hypothetical protein n=1 Tax=Nonomuraea salmonea TaxID=46181 RepID=UPI0031EC71EA